MTIDRRSFLSYLGTGTSALALAQLGVAADFPSRRKSKSPDFFKPIQPSSADELILPEGFSYDVVWRWDDPIGRSVPGKMIPEKFGFNNDFIAAFRLDELAKGQNNEELVLWVNHEYPNPLFHSGYTFANYKAGKMKTAEAIQLEHDAVGGSVVHVKRVAGKWQKVVGGKYNQRFTADYPLINFSGPARNLLNKAKGTLANCSGGVTPWHTALSCEENYPDFNGNDPDDFLFRWADVPNLAIDETQYGWIMEVDPFNELPPIKHTALGRFKHENAAVHVGKTGKLVVYMGDDEADQHLYKFVSTESIKLEASRAEQREVLESGTLYVANMSSGKWIPLVWNMNTKAIIEKSTAYADAKKKEPEFKMTNQAELLLNTRVAARALGATPLDRCEDCELHPKDGSLYVALTNNSRHGNYYGHIIRLCEENDNHEGDTFQYEIYLAGGPQTGLACPDNLAFDRAGNLWVVCDISSDKHGKGVYKTFENNGLFVVPTAGESAGEAFQFASGPVACELTGPCFSPDGSTLFLSVQHPGETSQTLQTLTSNWPDGKPSNPKPSVVAIRGFA